MSKRLNFTVARLEAIATPEKRIYLYDTKCPGLALAVTPNGAKAFFLYKKVHGRPERIRLGSLAELNVDTARSVCAKLLGEIAGGGNPAEKRRLSRGGMTLQELFDRYLDEHAKPHLRTWEDYERQFKKYLTTWANRRLQQVKRQDVLAMHAKIAKDHGPIQANRVLALLSSLFTRAATDYGFEGANPCKGIKRFHETKRDRFLQPAELRPFFESIKAEPNEVVRDFTLLLLFTGARRSNVESMQWSEVDLDRGIWCVPDFKSKTNKTLVIHLCGPALEILHRRKESANGSPYVLPSYGKCGHIVDARLAWKRMLQRAGIENLRLHDLRRSLGSWQAMTGASLPVIGASLGHSQPSTTAIYARLTHSPVADSVNRAVAAMQEAAAAKPKGKKTKSGKRSKKGGAA